MFTAYGRRALPAILLALALTACDDDKSSNSNCTLPAAAKALLEDALNNWNDLFAADVEALGWTCDRTLATAEDIDDLLDEITDPGAWLPIGDPSNPSSVNVARVQDDPAITPGMMADWRDGVDAMLDVGQYVVRTRWRKGTDEFTTLTVTTDDEIIYDNILYNISGAGTSTLLAAETRCAHIRMWWIWEKHKGFNGWTRGEIIADLKPDCSGQQIICNKNCSATMTGGDAKVNCKTTLADNCCIMEYEWAWACGFKSVEVEADGFKLKVEGYIGSSGSGNGSCSECCDR